MTMQPTKPYLDDDFDDVAQRAREGANTPPTTNRNLAPNPDEAVEKDTGKVSGDIGEDDDSAL